MRLRVLLCLPLLLCLAAITQAQTATLKWTEPTTTIGYGFKVYRAVQSGTACPVWGATAWSLLQGSINAATPTWADSTVVAGTTYCYAVTAYSTSGGGESAPSNVISLADPTAGGGSTGAPPSPTGLSGVRQ